MDPVSAGTGAILPWPIIAEGLAEDHPGWLEPGELGDRQPGDDDDDDDDQPPDDRWGAR